MRTLAVGATYGSDPKMPVVSTGRGPVQSGGSNPKMPVISTDRGHQRLVQRIGPILRCPWFAWVADVDAVGPSRVLRRICQSSRSDPKMPVISAGRGHQRLVQHMGPILRCPWLARVAALSKAVGPIRCPWLARVADTSGWCNVLVQS